MKKKLLLVFTFVGLMFGANTANAQVEEGSIIIDPYYGYPNFGKNLVSGLLDPDATDVTSKGIGPAGLRFEYMLADNLGLGLDFIYNSSGIEGTYLGTDSLGMTQTYTDKFLMQRIRVMLRFNFHFVQTDALDAYVGAGAGYNTRIWSYESTDPQFVVDESISGALLPVAFRAAIGARYYFHPNIGLNAELGIGGPVISGGISVKI
jgi:opacity protein-like surface antigen